MNKILLIFGILLLVALLAIPLTVDANDWETGQNYYQPYGGGYGRLTEEQLNKMEQVERKFINGMSNISKKSWLEFDKPKLILNSTEPDPKKDKNTSKGG